MNDTPPYTEYRQLYAGTGESLKVHLQTRLQPWRWPIMLSTGAIRVLRRGIAVPALTENEQLRSGDVIVIDDAFGPTWPKLMDEARHNFRDYVFCPQRNGDPFLEDQVKALLMEKTAQDVPLSHNNIDIKNLYALIANLIPLANHPIRHLIVVTHATERGELLFPLRNDMQKKTALDPGDYLARYVGWEGLQEAIALGDKNPLLIHDPTFLVNGKLPFRRDDGSRDNRFAKVLPRPERSDGKFVPFAFIIRGCSSGVHKPLLNKLRQALGYMVDIVVMPKFFDATARRGKEMVEYFQHDFEVSSLKEMTRAEIIVAFQKAKLRDWLGELVPDTDWEELVPQFVTSRVAAPARTMKVRVKGRSGLLQLSTYFDSGLDLIETRIMQQTEKPHPVEIRKFLIEGLEQTKVFKDGTGDWPLWKRWGLKSLKEFITHFVYEVDPYAAKAPNHWPVHGKRYYYQVRTPLLENGDLVADYHPGPGGAEPTRLINLNDDRIFGRSDPTKPDAKFPNVGKNFSRLL